MFNSLKAGIEALTATNLMLAFETWITDVVITLDCPASRESECIRKWF